MKQNIRELMRKCENNVKMRHKEKGREIILIICEFSRFNWPSGL
jgi:hypothetical protein